MNGLGHRSPEEDPLKGCAKKTLVEDGRGMAASLRVYKDDTSVGVNSVRQRNTD